MNLGPWRILGMGVWHRQVGDKPEKLLINNVVNTNGENSPTFQYHTLRSSYNILKYHFNNDIIK